MLLLLQKREDILWVRRWSYNRLVDGWLAQVAFDWSHKQSERRLGHRDKSAHNHCQWLYSQIMGPRDRSMSSCLQIRRPNILRRLFKAIQYAFHRVMGQNDQVCRPGPEQNREELHSFEGGCQVHPHRWGQDFCRRMRSNHSILQLGYRREHDVLGSQRLDSYYWNPGTADVLWRRWQEYHNMGCRVWEAPWITNWSWEWCDFNSIRLRRLVFRQLWSNDNMLGP